MLKNHPYIVGFSVLVLACGSGGGVSSAPVTISPNPGDSGLAHAGNGGDAAAGASDDAASASDDAATASDDAAGAAGSSVDAGEPADGATAKAPALVQHVSASNTRGNSFASPYCYYYQLPDPTTAGNAVVVGFTWSGSATPTVKDDKQDTYAIAENYFDAADKQSMGIATAFGVSAGARVISCASAQTRAPTCSRWRPNSRT